MNVLVLFPHIYAFSFGTTIFISFLFGIGYDSFYPVFPYLSDVFSHNSQVAVSQFFTALIAVVYVVIIYFKSLHWEALIESWAFNSVIEKEIREKEGEYQLEIGGLLQTTTREETHKANNFSFWIGICSAISLLATSSIRITDSYIIHNFFLFIFLVLCCVYFCYQTHLTGTFVNIANNENVFNVRFWISFTLICSTTIHVILDRFMFIYFGRTLAKYDFRTRDVVNHNIYWVFVLSSIAQWNAYISQIIFVFTFAIDFNRITVQRLKMQQRFRGHFPTQNYQALYRTKVQEENLSNFHIVHTKSQSFQPKSSNPDTSFESEEDKSLRNASNSSSHSSKSLQNSSNASTDSLESLSEQGDTNNGEDSLGNDEHFQRKSLAKSNHNGNEFLFKDIPSTSSTDKKSNDILHKESTLETSKSVDIINTNKANLSHTKISRKN